MCLRSIATTFLLFFRGMPFPADAGLGGWTGRAPHVPRRNVERAMMFDAWQTKTFTVLKSQGLRADR